MTNQKYSTYLLESVEVGGTKTYYSWQPFGMVFINIDVPLETNSKQLGQSSEKIFENKISRGATRFLHRIEAKTERNQQKNLATNESYYL